ncbi:hypothetical protein Y032_0287g1446 [Ancylostoma ceylanicum]|nr:hypothetical protein Y032_0287g1446 [Ancylostoma ceylanicum]
MTSSTITSKYEYVSTSSWRPFSSFVLANYWDDWNGRRGNPMGSKSMQTTSDRLNKSWGKYGETFPKRHRRCGLDELTPRCVQRSQYFFFYVVYIKGIDPLRSFGRPPYRFDLPQPAKELVLFAHLN